MATQTSKKQYTLIKKDKAASLSRLKESTLKMKRLQGELIEGVHWVRVNARVVYYRQELLEDWAATRHDPDAHLRAIEEFERHQKTGTAIDRLAPA
jgi:hypothetical protein